PLSIAPDCDGIELPDSGRNADRFECGGLGSKMLRWRAVDTHLGVLAGVIPTLDAASLEYCVCNASEVRAHGRDKVLAGVLFPGPRLMLRDLSDLVLAEGVPHAVHPFDVVVLLNLKIPLTFVLQVACGAIVQIGRAH